MKRERVVVELFPLRPVPGSSLDPRQVVGRDGTIALAVAEMHEGMNLLLSDPRRMGKTALLDRLCHLEIDGVVAVKIDYEGVDTVEDFLRRTIGGLKAHQQLWKRIARVVGLYVDVEVSYGGVTVKPAFARKAPEALLIDVVESIDNHLREPELLVVAMDEVPLAIGNIIDKEGAHAANQLLQALRRLRRNTGSSIRWIVTGSIGFHHVLRRCGATEGVVNDLVNLPLGPLQIGDAKDLARCLLLGIGEPADNEAVVAALVEHSGAIPYLLHALAHQLDDLDAVSAQDVEKAFAAFVADRDGSRAVTHFLTRLDQNYGDNAKPAYRVSDALAGQEPQAADELQTVGAGLQDRDVFLALMDDLQDDHYLVRDNQGWRWRYPVLRRIWQQRRDLPS